jgi:hypothetical protein
MEASIYKTKSDPRFVMDNIFFLRFKAVAVVKMKIYFKIVRLTSASFSFVSVVWSASAEWLQLLFLIREVPGSNFGPQTAIWNESSHGFPQSLLLPG